MKITKSIVDAMKAGDVIWDDEVKGFGARCQVKGKSFVLKCFVNGRQKFITIGKHGSPWTVQTARRAAQELLTEVRRGYDPVAERRKAAAEPTVDILCARYMNEYAWPTKPKSAALDASNIKNHIVPLIGRLLVAQVTRDHIQQLQIAIRNGKTAPPNPRTIQLAQRGGSAASGGPGVANRCLALLSKMFNLAEEWALRPPHTNPTRGVKRYPEKKIERFLSDSEVRVLGQTVCELEASGKLNLHAAAAVRLLCLTGARLAEIINLRWDQIDFEKRVIRLSDSKTGAKIIRLSPEAVEVLRAIPRLAFNKFVIAGAKPGRPLVGIKKIWSRIRTEAGLGDVRLHDLRHTFASVAVSQGAHLAIIGSLLGHSRITTTERYAHLSASILIEANDRVGAQIGRLMKRPAE